MKQLSYDLDYFISWMYPFKYKASVVFLTIVEPLLLTWINFNPNMDKDLHPSQSEWWNYLSIPKRQRRSRSRLGMDK